MVEPFECINDVGAAVKKPLQAQSSGWDGIWGNVGGGSSEVLQLKFSQRRPSHTKLVSFSPCLFIAFTV
jgi:hypothetical protein